MRKVARKRHPNKFFKAESIFLESFRDNLVKTLTGKLCCRDHKELLRTFQPFVFLVGRKIFFLGFSWNLYEKVLNAFFGQ